ncbi:MAG: glucoamylase family protein [Caldilineaceae bacterium]
MCRGWVNGLGDDHVVTPYASLLALSLDPHAVMENLDDLNARGLLGDYGYYEAVDFTEDRLPPGAKQAIVRSFMVHHQGMILLALLNYLHGDMCWSSAFTPTSAWKT